MNAATRATTLAELDATIRAYLEGDFGAGLRQWGSLFQFNMSDGALWDLAKRVHDRMKVNHPLFRDEAGRRIFPTPAAEFAFCYIAAFYITTGEISSLSTLWDIKGTYPSRAEPTPSQEYAQRQVHPIAKRKPGRPRNDELRKFAHRRAQGPRLATAVDWYEGPGQQEYQGIPRDIAIKRIRNRLDQILRQ